MLLLLVRKEAGVVVGLVLWGTLIGAILQLALSSCRLAPASVSAPAVAPMVDVSGLVIYFSIAELFLLGVTQDGT